MRTVNNSDVPVYAIRGEDARNGTDSFRTYRVRNRYDVPGLGFSCLHPRAHNNIDNLILDGRISHVILSYNTVITFKLDGVWCRIDARYSTTTSSKHESQLYMLPGARFVPQDGSIEEWERIAAGVTVYRRGKCPNSGRYTAA